MAELRESAHNHFAKTVRLLGSTQDEVMWRHAADFKNKAGSKYAARSEVAAGSESAYYVVPKALQG